MPNGSHAGRGTRTGNRSHMFADIPARNPTRGLRIRIGARARGTTPKRAAPRHFRDMETLRRTPVRCTGRIIRPGGKPILSMNGDDSLEGELRHALTTLNAAARSTQACTGLCNNRVTSTGQAETWAANWAK